MDPRVTINAARPRVSARPKPVASVTVATREQAAHIRQAGPATAVAYGRLSVSVAKAGAAGPPAGMPHTTPGPPPPDLEGQPPSTLVTSVPFTVSEPTGSVVPIVATGEGNPELSVDGRAFLPVAGVYDGCEVRIRVLTPDALGESRTVTVLGMNHILTWTVRT